MVKVVNVSGKNPASFVTKPIFHLVNHYRQPNFEGYFYSYSIDFLVNPRSTSAEKDTDVLTDGMFDLREFRPWSDFGSVTIMRSLEQDLLEDGHEAEEASDEGEIWF